MPPNTWATMKDWVGPGWILAMRFPLGTIPASTKFSKSLPGSSWRNGRKSKWKGFTALVVEGAPVTLVGRVTVVWMPLKRGRKRRANAAKLQYETRTNDTSPYTAPKPLDRRLSMTSVRRNGSYPSRSEVIQFAMAPCFCPDSKSGLGSCWI